MSKPTGLLVTFYCLIAYAIHICNSQWSGSFALQPINQRCASCPSCRRDCPAILSSPWYYLPATRDTRFAKSNENEYVPLVSSIESTPRRHSRSPWYGNVNPYERYFNGQTRNVNSHSVAAASGEFQKTNCRRECPCNSRVSSVYPFAITSSPLFEITPESRGISYYTKPDPWNHGISYRSPKLQMDSELNGDWIEYDEDPKSLLNGYFRRDVNSMIDKDVGVTQDPAREFLVVYSADDEELEEADSEENPYSIFASSPLNEFSKWTKGSAYGEYRDDIPMNAPNQMEKTLDDEISPERLDRLDEFDFSKLNSPVETVYAPEIKYNPYNLPPDLNILRMIENLEMPSQNPMQEQSRKNSVPTKRDNTNSMKTGLEPRQIEFVSDSDVFLQIAEREPKDTSQVPQQRMDDSKREINANENIQEQIETSDRLMEEMSRRSRTINKDTLSFAPNPDFINDMVNPTIVSTESTPTESPMETSTTA